MQRRVIAMVLAVWLASQPLMSLACRGAASPMAQPRTRVIMSAPAAPARAAAGNSAHAGAEDAKGGRGAIAARLIELGSSPAEAEALALQLTPADLVVLLANPRMMQAAGEMDAQTRNIIWGLVILGGIIAVAAASEGTVSIN